MKHLLLLLSITATGHILKPGHAADAPILAVRGGSIELQVQRKLMGMDVDYIVWRFNIEHPVIKYSNESKHPLKVYKEYTSRAAIVGTTYNLRLSDLSELDNGTYSARIMDHHGYEHDVAKHQLVVHEAVPELDFSMTLLYFNSTEGYCNVSVSCSAEDSYVSYTCDLDGCVEDQLVLLKPHLAMSVVGADGTVACNASNLVSAKSRWGRMSAVCTEELVYQPMSLLGPTLIVLDIITPILLICLILYFLLIRPKHIGDLKTMELKSKALAAASSVELLHVHEFEEVLKDPSLPDYLKGAAVYSISKGRTPPLPKLALIQERRHHPDPVSLVKL